MQHNFYPDLISECYIYGKFWFYVISPSSWTPRDTHGGYVMVEETRFMLRSRRVLTERTSLGIFWAQTLHGVGPPRRDR